jgi:predicted MFS family arabinose efflux permease
VGDVEQKSIWRNRPFRVYLGTLGFAGVATAMHQLLVSWLLVGVLLLPATQVGSLQALIALPGIFLLLWGGVIADRSDPRTILVYLFAAAPVLTIGLIAVDQADALAVWPVTLWGLGMSAVISFSSAPQQTLLNSIAGDAVQQAVTLATALMFLTQVVGLAVAGQMERLGLTPVLVVQAASLALAAVTLRYLAAQPQPISREQTSAWYGVREGFAAVWAQRVLRDTLLINFVSSVFNAGAFMTVFPFIVKRIYEGDAWLLATLLVVFYGAATFTNIALVKFMPLARPGRTFLVLQLSRIVFLVLLWIRPDWWLLVVALIAWGMNMGVTTTLARTIVQESAEPGYRARILSVYSLSLLGSLPIGAVVLGWIIEAFGTLNALIPGMITSLALFIWGAAFSDVWRYRSP